MKTKAFNKYAEFFAIIKKIGREKDEVVEDFTAERLDENGEPGNLITNSLSKLSVGEYAELMRRLKRFNEFPPGDDMRKSIIATFRNMRYEKWSHKTGKMEADMPKINSWCINAERSPFKKALIDHSPAELQTLVTGVKRIYEWYLTAN